MLSGKGMQASNGHSSKSRIRDDEIFVKDLVI
jgi:hypothetical protein